MIYKQEIDKHTVKDFKKLLDNFPDDATLIFDERLFEFPDPKSFRFADDLIYDDWTNEVKIICGQRFEEPEERVS